MKAFSKLHRSLLEKSQIENEENYTSTPNYMEARYERKYRLSNHKFIECQLGKLTFLRTRQDEY
jgi:hypothetical protein